MQVTNRARVSYPGYNEIFTGAFDPRIDSNEYPPNPNETVFEWLNTRPAAKPGQRRYPACLPARNRDHAARPRQSHLPA